MTSALLRDLRTWRFWRHLTTHLFAAIGFISSTLLGLYGVLAPKTVSHHVPLFVLAIPLLSLMYALVRAWPRPIEQRYNSPNTLIRVIEGDLFAQQTNLAIGVCDTFDTQPPNIIERTSVQGQFLSKVYNDDVDRLDQDLTTALAAIPPIDTVTKEGKTNRYDIGTVAKLQQSRTTYFCVAYTTMDAQNNAQGTADGVWKSLNSLWQSVSVHANGQPLAMPVIGGGMARMSSILPAQDSIRFMILSFILASRDRPVCERLDIVVHPTNFKNLDRLELQAFLRSLRAS